VLASVNWNDNPWFPEVLKKEKDTDYANDPEMADHVWGGGYEVVSEATYYARLIADADSEGRIGDFPHDPRRPVKTAWDIGIDDYTSIWFIQDDGVWATAIDYYETSGLGAEQIVREALPELMPDDRAGFLARNQIGRDEPFSYGEHFLPHNVKNREWGAAGRTRALTLMGFGVKPIHVGAALPPVERINAARALLPRMRFNRTPRVMLGVSRLRRYSRRRNESMQTFSGPLHDDNSHGADAFGEYAVNCSLIAPKPPPKQKKAAPRGTVLLAGAPIDRPSKRTRI
jgi:phage terminase large subunit